MRVMAATEITQAGFWKCISIFLRNYHAVNKKIFACKLISVRKVKHGLCNIDVENSAWEASQLSRDAVMTPSTETELREHLEIFEQMPEDFEGFVISLNLLMKKSPAKIEAVSVVDFRKQLFVCKYILCNTLDDLCIRIQENQLQVYLLTQRVDVEQSNRWCKFVLQPKLLSWCTSKTNAKQHVGSLRLIDVEMYNELYRELKHKYADAAMKFWADARETTDPLKFIYEDLAIASYLICLWRQTRSIPTAFADLGCGNGLLVHILSQEGYVGYGYDVRARRLWSLYPKETRLIEQTIHPNNFKLPAEVDWLIGNHSDELSPWVPVLAATASRDMRYFLLPCCAYEFSGSKFQRRNSSVSVYGDFIEYVKQISSKCGYRTQQDRLKIPSTKRTALVGIDREHGVSEFKTRTKEIWSFVSAEREAHGQNETGDIKLRVQCEVVRNCTQLDKAIIEELVVKIFRILLQLGSKTEADPSKGAWIAGEPLSMRTIVENLSAEDLKHIKNECGGIKTLLRNHRAIFEFCGGNLVAIRRPQVFVKGENSQQTVKKRQCFFQKHHPSGCPLASEECAFVHV